MPYKFQYTKQKIPRKLNRNVKLSLEQHKEIVLKYSKGNTSQRKLASEYGVSRRLIQFILDPEKLKRNRELHKSSTYYDKEKYRISMRNHRRYKQSIKDKLINNEDEK